MPELPEVEIVRRGLEPVMRGQTITRVEQRRPDLRFPFPDGFSDRIEGRTVVALGRRAKYLVLTLSDETVLIMHLGMSGRFSIIEQGKTASFGEYVYSSGADEKHDHVVFTLGNGARVIYNDPRRFGFMLLDTSATWEQHPLFAGLGVEPLGNQLSASVLASKAAGRNTDLKAFLLDQRNIAGLGNIYVSEALHLAGLSPYRKAATLTLAGGGPSVRAERLVPQIRAVLEAAIAAGGSTLKDYRQADGSAGEFQNAFAVYGRDGEPCLRAGCTGTIRRTVQAQRATYACSQCQR